MTNWTCGKTLVLLCMSALWWSPEVLGISKQQAAHLKRRIAEVTLRVEQVNLTVVNTHGLLNSLGQTDLTTTVSTSCREVKSRRSAARDGEYTLYPFSTCPDVSIRVYCHNMSSNNPAEFLPLPSGPDSNFASRYGDRLQWSSAVWYRCTGPLFGYWNQAGTTKFSKVRVKFENSAVKIIQDDYTFSTTTGNNDVPYGVSGDCYSPRNGCARGTFQVDLTGTELVLAPSVQWVMFATWPGDITVQDMHISGDRKVASARCGGWCGHCVPEGDNLLLTHPQCTVVN
ncbi:A disintegrin and metalloproteinase with thrombospondin motifs 9-like [Branchiostoma lanceolatum]|uniref:A disintegrin and metalloproteinase with thrombospondin motifs 9-like n=1 Tax=Branchiostoma lanceolatum TaxID=7740 RepID=UPI003453F698